MKERRVLPYGSWPSPISLDMAVSSALSLSEVRVGPNAVYWTEGRPAEAGRQVIVRSDETGGASDVTPPPFNARTAAHEYGGGWYAVDHDKDVVYFSNLADGRIYRQELDHEPVALTPDGPFRYGDLVVDAARNRLLCIREDMSAEPEPRDSLIAVDTTSGAETLLTEGYDFYSTPRPSPDGDRLAWLSWRHPNMPWDTTELWVADVTANGQLANAEQIAGGGEESIVQPEWAPDGSLVFASDRSGWWNLYRWTAGADPVALAPMQAEFAAPQWIFGMRWFGVASDGTVVATVHRQGRDELWMIPLEGPPEQIEVPDTVINSLSLAGRRVAYIGATALSPRAVVLLDLDRGERRELRAAFVLEVDPSYISVAEEITFPTTDGDISHALYYPPTNPDLTGPADEKPPLVVMSHGGPTSRSPSNLSLGIQTFTSRGFGVVDVNYRGSSGYGREYMRKLDGKWGIYDVDDCIAAARFLAKRGDIDEARMAIRGGSAGGYTTLCALVFHDGVFAAGASYFGVGDMEGLARDTHKFESRYSDRLVAPYPERVDVYRERSPIHFMDRITRPLIVLQGGEDKVVPQSQADELVESLRARKVPHSYLLFPEEGHGFRQAANLRQSLAAELSFYAQVFGFDLADAIEPVQVEFLST